ncbi:MAG TPA: cellulase family glycosylhydrolase [Kineosporiaceae bacterium]|nr:cellulase family glycosylhydrolase [Kineosporiaceae bacterium]
MAKNMNLTRVRPSARTEIHGAGLWSARLAPLIALAVAAVAGATPVQAATDGERSPVSVSITATDSTPTLRDAEGREVTLRGFNVSGSTKLAESGFLPFRSTADAAFSAQAMRDQTGANVVRFLINWGAIEPTAGTVDTAYLAKVAAQIQAFTDRGIYVLLDYHQDLYSQYLFNSGSWYTGDGAPKWVITGGAYPQESCGICLLWGQNMQSNGAVRKAMTDFWHNRVISTSAGQLGVQDAYIAQSTKTMTYLRQQLSASAFANVLGMDPFNEPFDGGLDGGSGTTWETTYLMPFYQRFRAAMDTAGWTSKPLYAEPLVFWNAYMSEQGGLSTAGTLGTRYVFNSHYYDGARMTLDQTWPNDGTYSAPMAAIRTRAAELGTAPFVSEFGSSLGESRTPWIIRGQYEGMDHAGTGASWWTSPAGRGDVLSSTQWHWDIYNGKHHELMNGNASKVQTTGDAFNGEDFSVIQTDSAGAVVQRLDPRVVDRIFPSAVAGSQLAFATEDLARDRLAGTGTATPWLTVPSTLPTIAGLTAGHQYAVLAWRQPASTPTSPTEVHVPATFTAGHTTVISDLGTMAGVPASGAVAFDTEIGSTVAHRLALTSNSAAGTVHVALVIDSGTTVPTAAQLAAANSELIAWQKAKLP